MLFTDDAKARCLNNYFSSVVFTIEKPDILQLRNSDYQDMSDIEVTQPGVLKLLASLDPKKSTGTDQPSPRMLKEVSSEVTPVLTYIFNQSLYLQALYPSTGGLPISSRSTRRGPET